MPVVRAVNQSVKRCINADIETINIPYFNADFFGKRNDRIIRQSQKKGE